MINAESNGNSVASGGTPAPAHDKQLLKKIALRDVQNQNAGTARKTQDSLLRGSGKSNGDAMKACGTKRLTPERPSISHGLPSQLAHNGTNENVVNARRRFELEFGRGRFYTHVEKNTDFSEVKSVGQKSTQKSDSNNVHHGPAAIFSSKQVNINSTASEVDSKVNGDQLRAERFVRLQSFMKQCDEANQMEYNKRLLSLSPPDLNKHAVDLEKRAIQLTIEEVLKFGIAYCPAKETEMENNSFCTWDLRCIYSVIIREGLKGKCWLTYPISGYETFFSSTWPLDLESDLKAIHLSSMQ